MKRKWNIRRYREGDEKGICTLFEKVFGRPMGKTESISHWNWEYKNNPNDDLDIFLAVDENEIVGHYAVIPIKMRIDVKDYLTTLSLDTMVHEDYRGQDMFPILAKALYESLEKRGVPITYGFPNANSIEGIIKKLDWFEIADLPLLVKPINFKTLLYRYIKNRAVSNILGACLNFFSLLPSTVKRRYKNITIKNIEKFDKEFDRLWDNVKNEITIGVIRDSKYLNWRYIQKPENDYTILSIYEQSELKGYIVLKIEERFNLKIGFVVDILTSSSNPSYPQQLITKSILFFKNEDVDVISCLMFPQHKYYKILKKKGFIKVFKKYFPKEIYFGARVHNDLVEKDMIKNEENWFLTWGDTDVI